ncbi:hypothetical protein K474DRAFT_200773 [Panus rudis PR-1116 ss-1]|nr:hypothetical protein K474DRAFT_200773 [Panus rudis PR-1116 ss-1]
MSAWFGLLGLLLPYADGVNVLFCLVTRYHRWRNDHWAYAYSFGYSCNCCHMHMLMELRIDGGWRGHSGVHRPVCIQKTSIIRRWVEFGAISVASANPKIILQTRSESKAECTARVHLVLR